MADGSHRAPLSEQKMAPLTGQAIFADPSALFIRGVGGVLDL